MKSNTGSILAALLLAGTASILPAQNSAPVAVPIARNVPDAVDTPWPGGPIRLKVDATDITRGLFRVTETIPLAPGTRSLTLLYPEWLPGKHGPRGAMAELVDLRFMVDGQPVRWVRDPVEVFAFHLELPEGAKEVVASFVHTSPLQTSEGRVTMTPDMLNLQWESVSLYPAGHYVRQIRVRPSVDLPKGWKVAGALDGMATALHDNNMGPVAWDETDYATLIDSPLFAGRNYRKWDLGQNVTLNVFADRADSLEATPAQIAPYRALVEEARLAFGANHFDRYEFLLALSDRLGSIGLEHHRSSENQLEPDAFTRWEANEYDRNLLPHEYSHSWSGKFRRPARLWTPDYRQPMQGDLLWAYEGQDQFWGLVLAARSGVQGKDMALGMLASWAGLYADHPGRRWRSIEDTGSDPVFAARKPKPYATMARGEDYYREGALVWLEADQIIRANSGGRKSIDDFTRRFFGMRDGDWGELTFELADVAADLNAVVPNDWEKFLKDRLLRPGQPAPIGGIELGGYRLAWRDKPNPYDEQRMAAARTLELTYSLGLALDREGTITATEWGSPAFKAGIVNGARLIAVDGEVYEADRLRQAIARAASGADPIELIVRRGDRVQVVRIDYHGGLKWPWLERAAPGTAPTGLDRLLAPRRAISEVKSRR